MADTRYMYQGPPSGVTLVEGDGDSKREREVRFDTGEIVALPADHPHVKSLVAQDLLAPVPAEPSVRRRSTTSTTTADPAEGS